MSEQIKNLVEYKVSNLPSKFVRFNYDPNRSKKLRDGTQVSNKGVGYPYSIKLSNNQTILLDLNNPKEAFMVEKLSKYLTEIPESKVEILDEVNEVKEIKTDNKGINTVEKEIPKNAKKVTKSKNKKEIDSVVKEDDN